MEQNFLGSLLQVESGLGITDVGYNFVTQGFEFTEPVFRVAFLVALVKQFRLGNVLVNFLINPGGA